MVIRKIAHHHTYTTYQPIVAPIPNVADCQKIASIFPNGPCTIWLHHPEWMWSLMTAPFFCALEAPWANGGQGYDYTWGSCHVQFLNDDTDCASYVSSQGFDDPHVKNPFAGGVPQHSPTPSIILRKNALSAFPEQHRPNICTHIHCRS